jgi:hypothetical protein
MSHGKRFSMLGLLVVGLTLGGVQVTSAAPTNGLQPNDEFIVARPNAPLMRGSSTLATLPQGERLRVLKIEGPWVGTAVMVNGRKVGGWVWAGQAATPQQYTAMRSSMRRYSVAPTTSFGPTGGYSMSPGYNTTGGYGAGPDGVLPNQESPNHLILGATPYGRSYWRADRKVIGY